MKCWGAEEQLINRTGIRRCLPERRIQSCGTLTKQPGMILEVSYNSATINPACEVSGCVC